jgi:hypothetical protein
MGKSYFNTRCAASAQPFKTCTSEDRFTDKTNTATERQLLYQNWFTEQINLYGQKVNYYQNQNNTVNLDNLYGENPTIPYNKPKPVIMMIELNESAPMLSQFGLMGDDDITCYITISGFYQTFGTGEEPKSGDILELSEFGSDRPGGRTGRCFQVTQRLDEDINKINPLMGHYCWLIKGKRFDFSFEPGAPKEGRSDQVIDDTLTGTFSGVSALGIGNYNPILDNTNDSSVNVFDYSKYGNNDDIYGGYQ